MRVLDRLHLYLARQFFKGFFTVYMGLAFVVLLFDSVELMRRASGREFVPFRTILEMGLLKLPQMMEMLLPFVFLFGAMFAFWRLNRSHELVVIRTGGVSVWQFLKPALAVAALWGVMQVSLFNPFSAALYAKYSQLEAKYFERGIYQSFISTDGLWIRQIETDFTMILHANIVEPDLSLREINAFIFDPGFVFQRRIDADTAILSEGSWTFDRVTVTEQNGDRTSRPKLQIISSLTLDKIQESFAPPESLSVWKLPGFITVLENSGFSAMPHRLYFHSMLTTPFMLMAMVLIAACFTISPARHQKTVLLIVGGIFCGFVFYTFSDIVHALGGSGRIPVIFAAWAPFFITAFLGIATLLHNEDG